MFHRTEFTLHAENRKHSSRGNLNSTYKSEKIPSKMLLMVLFQGLSLQLDAFSP